MRPELLGMLIGGLVPAVLFAIDGTSSKAASRAGMSWAPFLIVSGIAVVAVGALGLFIDTERRFTATGAAFSMLKGVMWSVGCALIVVAIDRFQAPLSKLVPLYSLSTVLAVVASLMLFHEHLAVSLPRLILGTLLALCGAVLVATA